MGGEATFPLKRYLPWVAGAGLFGAVTMYIAQQAAAQLSWWEIMPWGVIMIFFLGGFVGTLYADCINSSSSLRNWWRTVRAIGCFGDVYNRSLYHDLGPGHGGKQHFISIHIPFTLKRHAAIDTVRLTSQVHNFDGQIIEPPRACYTWKVSENVKLHKRDTIDIAVAHIPADSIHPGVYGDLNISGYYLSAGSAHRVTIEIFGGKKPETHKILIILPGTRIYARQSGRMDEVNPGGRFLVFQEGEDLFPKLQ